MNESAYNWNINVINDRTDSRKTCVKSLAALGQLLQCAALESTKTTVMAEESQAEEVAKYKRVLKTCALTYCLLHVYRWKIRRRRWIALWRNFAGMTAQFIL
jgi:hypothetical protein